MSERFADERAVMQRAIELAARGVGRVEPNPPVGAVIVDDRLALLGQGYHDQFGGPHAEINALEQAGSDAAGATMFVTLEPCCHHGKTGPCSEALIAAGIRKVVIGLLDPSAHASGQGAALLSAAGIDVESGFLHQESRRLAAPFCKLVETGLPYVHAKWAMTLDGKIASRTGSSMWISSELSRAKVHELRGRMEAVIVGAGTAKRDDPLLTPRPPGPRVPTRIVLNGNADLSTESQLVQTAGEGPVLVVARETAAAEHVERLQARGVEVLRLPGGEGDPATSQPKPDLRSLLSELGKRRMTNVLVEGGGALLGAFFDARLIDEAHVFIAPKLIGGAAAVTPVAGQGLADMASSATLTDPVIQMVGCDVYLHGPVAYSPANQESRNATDRSQ